MNKIVKRVFNQRIEQLENIKEKMVEKNKRYLRAVQKLETDSIENNAMKLREALEIGNSNFGTVYDVCRDVDLMKEIIDDLQEIYKIAK